MDGLNKEQAFQLHYEFENIDEALIEEYGSDIDQNDERDVRAG